MYSQAAASGDNNMSASQQQKKKDWLIASYAQLVPHSGAMGTQIVAVTDGVVHARLPYREAFGGDPAAGLWHTSVALSLVDGVCGLAVLLTLPQMEGIATLDLRMDYLRPAVCEQPLHARAHCYHMTRSIAFVHADVDQGDRNKPTARCRATFMRTSAKGNIGKTP